MVSQGQNLVVTRFTDRPVEKAFYNLIDTLYFWSSSNFHSHSRTHSLITHSLTIWHERRRSARKATTAEGVWGEAWVALLATGRGEWRSEWGREARLPPPRAEAPPWQRRGRGDFQGAVGEWVSEWESEGVSEWVREWGSEGVREGGSTCMCFVYVYM